MNRPSAGGSKTRSSHKKRRWQNTRAPMQDATRHTERPTDASVAPAAASVPFERSSPGRGRMGGEELVDGSTCALAVPMATTSAAASSPQPAAVAADDTVLTAAPSRWRQQQAQRRRLKRCRSSSSTTRASVTLRDPSGSAPSLAPSRHDDTDARATSVEHAVSPRVTPEVSRTLGLRSGRSPLVRALMRGGKHRCAACGWT